MRIALVGQPNCGKSTLFNHLVGYRAHTSNLPGTTVEVLASRAWISGKAVEVVDLPGTYSLITGDQAEATTRSYLEAGGVDAVLNVVDASLLSRSLELTLELLELGVPMVVCLNMADEARRKGVSIDADRLAERLGVPVVPAVAVRGVGVLAAARAAVGTAVQGASPPTPSYGKDVEEALHAIERVLPAAALRSQEIPPRLAAIRLLEKDPAVGARIDVTDELDRSVERAVAPLVAARGVSGEAAMSAERHARAMAVFEEVARVGAPAITARDRIDRLLMHPWLGVLLFAAIMYGFFVVVFRVGALAEAPIIGWFDALGASLVRGLAEGGLAAAAVGGAVQGIGGVVGIVLPYLVPFLIGMALLEDVGYLPRAGYLLDGLMHRIGLHGKSMIPFLLGYGCSVPAILATRIIESPRDRFVTAMLAVMFPCVARTTIIFGLVGYFLGPHLAFAVYLINLVVIALVGWALTRILPSVSPGLILEIPSYKVPSAHVVAAKVWLRAREFFVFALPILVLGSVVLALLDSAGATRVLNTALLPITWALGLPAAVGVTLIFGVLRKELALVMLFQALGTVQVATVLSAGQMMVFTLFLLFYVPCVAAVAALVRELGRTRAATVVAATTAVALVVGLLARAMAALLS